VNTAIQMKAEIASYLRFTRAMPLVAFELDKQDIVAIGNSRHEIWVEIKVSIADLVSDRRKAFHQAMCEKRSLPLFTGRAAQRPGTWFFRNFPNRFYFGVPDEIHEKALTKIQTFFPWAGLLVSMPINTHGFAGHRTRVAKDADLLQGEKVSIQRISALVKAQSASLANLAAKCARLTER